MLMKWNDENVRNENDLMLILEYIWNMCWSGRLDSNGVLGLCYMGKCINKWG